MLVNSNSSAVWSAEWFPKRYERQNSIPIEVEIIGVIRKDRPTPIQNMMMSRSGTVIKTMVPNKYDNGQELYMLGYWWRITNVDMDFTSVSPQAYALGSVPQNIVYELTIVGAGEEDNDAE